MNSYDFNIHYTSTPQVIYQFYQDLTIYKLFVWPRKIPRTLKRKAGQGRKIEAENGDSEAENHRRRKRKGKKNKEVKEHQEEEDEEKGGLWVSGEEEDDWIITCNKHDTEYILKMYTIS